MSADKLRQAIALIKAGDKQTALPILKDIVRTEPNNEMAWLWLFSCVEIVSQKIYCLNKALEINPNNEKAREVLDKLIASTQSAQVQAEQTDPEQVKSQYPQAKQVPHQATLEKSIEQQRFSQKPVDSSPIKRKASTTRNIIIAVLLSLFCVCGGVTGGTWIFGSGLSVAEQYASTPNDSIYSGVEAAHSATFATTPTLVPTDTFTLSPTTIAIPIFPTDPNMFVATIPASENTLRFYFIDVGQGDASLIQTPDGKTIIIDGGETDTGIVSQLQSLGVQRFDLMIATHPHADHIGGLVQVLQSIPVAKVVTNGQSHTTSVYERFLDEIVAAQAEYVEVKRGDVLTLGGIDIRVLNPANVDNPELNENSIVLQFKYGQATFLMMGDSGADTEAALLSAGLPLKADILKVGHHGSSSGSTLTFLNAVQPEIALYSAGINNQYGLPDPQTIEALKEVGATVYGTDIDGSISVKVDLASYTISTVKDGVSYSSLLPTATVVTFTPSVSGTLEIVSVTSPVSRGANATVIAKTSPSASCTITVYYKSGASTAAGLDPKKADTSGMVSWTWKVGTRTTPGTWKIVVTCNGVKKETMHEVK